MVFDFLNIPENKFQYILKTVLFAAIYLVAAKLGLLLSTINNNVTPIWPPTGIAFSFLLLFGRRYWFSIALGAFLANISIGSSFNTALPISMGNTIEAVAGVWIFQRLRLQEDHFGIHSRSFGFIVSSTLAACLSALIGTTSLAVYGIVPWDSFGPTLLTWWSGDALGGTIFFPLVLSLLHKEKVKINIINYVLIAAVGSLISWKILIEPQGMTYLFVFFPFFFFAIARAGEKGASVALMTAISFSFYSLKTQHGAFHAGETHAHLVNLQLFQLTLAVTALFLCDFKRAGFFKAPATILFFGWALSGFVFAAFYNQNQQITDVEFNNLVEKVEASLKAKMEKNITALQSGAGFFAGSNRVSNEDWKNFFDNLNLDTNLNGLLGLGEITIVPKNRSQAYLKTKGADFNIRSLGVNPLKDYFIIEHVEPVNVNNKARGLDVASEQTRREAAELSRDTGEPAITLPISLVQSKKTEPGFLLFYPFYQKGPRPTTLNERRQKIRGWIYAPVIMKNFFASVFEQNDFKFLTYSLTPLNKNVALIQSNDFNDAKKEHFKEKNLKLFNQTYKLSIGKVPGYLVAEHTLPFWVAAVAALLTLGFGAFIVNSRMLGQKAQLLADKMTQKLKQSEEKLKIIFESAHQVLFLVSRGEDGKLHCISVNNTHEEMTGIPTANFLGKTLDEFLPEDVYQKNLAYYEEARRTGKSVQWEVTNNYPTGTKHCVFTIVAVKSNASEELYVGTILDITERKRAEEMLNQQQAKLTLSAKMSSLGEMAGGIAHEINNPLTIIISKAVILRRMINQENPDFEKIKKDLTKIEETSNRIAKIIRGLRSFSRNTEGDPMEIARVTQIVDDTLELCKERFKYHSIDLKIDNQTSGLIYCRPHQITQVLMNLLTNAFDAVEGLKEKWVAIEVKEFNNQVTITVKDSGHGIPEAIAEKMMNPFFTTKDVGKGTGLGLSISKGIIEDHCGHIKYYVREGHTCFTLEFPSARDQKQAA